MKGQQKFSFSQRADTEVSNSEIFGAITFRIFWADIKWIGSNIIFVFILFALLAIAFAFFDFESRIGGELYSKIEEISMYAFAFWFFGAIISISRLNCLHTIRFFFPRLKKITVFLISSYLSFTLWISLHNFENILFFVISVSPLIYTYRIMNHGYFLVMMKRHKNYLEKPFAIRTPPMLAHLAASKGGVCGTKPEGEEWAEFWQ